MCPCSPHEHPFPAPCPTNCSRNSVPAWAAPVSAPGSCASHSPHCHPVSSSPAPACITPLRRPEAGFQHFPAFLTCLPCKQHWTVQSSYLWAKTGHLSQGREQWSCLRRVRLPQWTSVWHATLAVVGDPEPDLWLFSYMSLQTGVLLPSKWWPAAFVIPLVLFDSFCFVNPCRWNDQPGRKIQLRFMQRHFSSDGCILSAGAINFPGAAHPCLELCLSWASQCENLQVNISHSSQ